MREQIFSVYLKEFANLVIKKYINKKIHNTREANKLDYDQEKMNLKACHVSRKVSLNSIVHFFINKKCTSLICYLKQKISCFACSKEQVT